MSFSISLRKIFFGAMLVLATASANAAHVKLIDVANSQARDGAYAGFYTLNIDGQTVLGMCDDFDTNSFVGEEWTADVFAYPTLNGGGGKFGPNPVRYSQIGYLFSLAPAATFSQQASIDEAIWKIMTPSAAFTLTGDALSYFNTATNGSKDSFDYTNYMLAVTPNPHNATQEFLIVPGVVPPSSVPIPSALWLMFSGLVGLFGVSRRRKI